MIEFYNNYIKDSIEILKDIAFVISIFPIVIVVRKYLFNKKKEEIANNLKIRKEIQKKLLEYANGYDRSTPHPIGIRLVHWKNYPWKLEDDGYKQILYYDVDMDKFCQPQANFLSNTGILIESALWHFSKSVYLGKYDIYIIDKKGKKIRGFQEIEQDTKLVHTLKYKHIINWDFEEKIEYEPVFYTRYKYSNKKLFENDFIIRNFYGRRMPAPENRTGGEYLCEVLNRSNKVSSNRSLKYFYLLIKYKFKNK